MADANGTATITITMQASGGANAHRAASARNHHAQSTCFDLVSPSQTVRADARIAN